MHKKAVISYYIILGVSLLLIFAIIFSFTSRTGYEFSKDVLPDRFKKHPVISFVDECVKEITFQGIQRMGAHAGYINPGLADMSFSPNPIEGSGVFVGDVFIPYWYYLNEKDRFDSEMPFLCKEGCKNEGLNSMEEQLSLYIDENLERCIIDFKGFENSYDIEEEPFLNEVIIRDNDVLIKVVYPLIITSKADSSIEEIRNFNTKIPVPLKEIYTFSKKITETETQNSFIENHILNMIALYSGMGSDLPPMSELKIGSNDLKFWIRTSVEETIKYEILDFVRLLQVVNSGNFNPIYLMDREGANKVIQGVYNSMSFRVDEKDYDNLEVSFIYPSSHIELSIEDSELIFPENKMPMSNFVFDLLQFSMYDYSFDYDLAFPVIVTVVRRDAYMNRDLSFRFALEANIRNNLPLTTEFDLDAKPSTYLPSFSNIEQRVNKTIIITVINNMTEEPINNVNIYYTCGNEAYIGKTSSSNFTTKLPFCMFGGKIIAKKKGYLTDVIDFNNYDDNISQKFTMGMYQLVNKKIEIRKIDEASFKILSKPKSPLIDWKQIAYTNSKPLGDNERVILTINRQKSNIDENNIPLMGFIDYKKGDAYDYTKSIIEDIEKQFAEGEITKEEKETMITEITDTPQPKPFEVNEFDLVPGDYDIQAHVIYEDNITIPEKREEFCPCTEILGICLCEMEEIIYPEQSLDAFPIGGADALVTIKEKDIYSDKDKVIFYVFTFDVPKTWDDFQNFKQMEDYKDYDYLLNPTFIK